MTDAYESILRKAQILGQSIYSEDMGKDANFWAECDEEWGKGSGYRSRVAKRSESWFDKPKHAKSDQRVCKVTEREWSKAVTAVRDLIALG